MKSYKIGNQWRVTYRCPGYPKIINESFSTEEEANLRCAQIDLEKKRGTLQPPANLLDPDCDLTLYRNVVTVEMLMEEYINSYGIEHWSVNTLSCNRHRIEDYIIPYLGDVLLKDLTTHRLERFYRELQEMPAVKMKGHEHEEKPVSFEVIKKVHALLRNALNQAIRWDYLQGANPALAVELPKHKKQKQPTWTDREVLYAIQVCEDPILRLCILLAVGCSMRIGEILGLTWDCVHITSDLIQSGNAYLTITKELVRCDKSSLDALKKKGRDDVYFYFPSCKKTESSTVLVLKAPKTESSVRTNFIPTTVATALIAMKDFQESAKAEYGSQYQDFGLVIAQENGRPFERRFIHEKLKQLIVDHDLKSVTFHSLRHSSTTIKLRLSGGDIKSVQGDTGHSVADMVTNVYSEIQDDDRKQLSSRMEQEFFSMEVNNSPVPVSTSDESDAALKILRLMRDAPDKADKLLQIAELLCQ